MDRGVPLEGICLYPIINHPGWDDDRACQTGLLEGAGFPCRRETHRALADEILRQQDLGFESTRLEAVSSAAQIGSIPAEI
jgi:hypothetical protein